MIHIVSRRSPNWIVTLVTMLLVAMLVSACGGATPVPATETTAPTPKPAEPTAAPEISPHQAPQWQEMVAAGELPPLEERLPVNPMVLDTVGVHRRVWRHDAPSPARFVVVPPLLLYGQRKPGDLDAQLGWTGPQRGRVLGCQRRVDRVHLLPS